eukprot:3310991-Rhodomonas_salina.2
MSSAKSSQPAAIAIRSSPPISKLASPHSPGVSTGLDGTPNAGASASPPKRSRSSPYARRDRNCSGSPPPPGTCGA